MTSTISASKQSAKCTAGNGRTLRSTEPVGWMYAYSQYCCMGAAVLAHFSAFSYTMALIQLPLLSYTLLIIIHGYFLACHHLPQPLHKSFARLDVGITHLQDVFVVFWILSGNFVWYMTWYRSCVESESGLVWLLKLNDSSVPHSLSWCNMVATYIVPEFFIMIIESSMAGGRTVPWALPVLTRRYRYRDAIA